MFGCGWGSPQPLGGVGGAWYPTYATLNTLFPHTLVRHTHEMYVFEPVFLQVVWFNVVISMLVLMHFWSVAVLRDVVSSG